jgi:acetyltransferase-like isoleucine patch superfamily enzyme
MKLEVAPGARADIHPTATVGADSRIQVIAGALEIGADAVLGDGCVIVVRHGVRVGAAARLGDRVVLIDFGPSLDDVDRPVRQQPLRTAPITIGDGAIIGHGSVLEAGASVPPRTRVPEHTVVTA